MGFGEAAVGGAGGGEVGGAHLPRAVGGGDGDVADGVGQAAQVAAQDFREQHVQVAEIVAQGGTDHAQGERHGGEADGVAAVHRHDGLRDGEDAFFASELAGGELGALVMAVGGGAEDAGWCAHGGGG